MGDYRDQYNTPLSPEDEALFQVYLGVTNRAQDLNDYDLRGAWKSKAAEAANGHLPDTYKKPNHPTFSNESQYSGKDGLMGGAWAQTPNGKWSFAPGPTNLQTMPLEQLQQYFRQREPDATLVIPK